MKGTVDSLYIAAEGGRSMMRVAEVEAVAGCGLQGDRYMTRRGYWTGVDECQVTLIQKEILDEITADTSIDVSEGQHRRNIVTTGMELMSLAGRRFRVGAAVFEFDRPRPPCGYIQSITQVGMTRALLGTRGGICARVLESGVIRTGDEVTTEV